MNILWIHVLHQAIFGGIAAAGFGILFNTPPRIIGLCFASGAIALATRTIGMDSGLSLPVSSFIAALVVSLADRAFQDTESLRGSVLAVVGCIPMVPGSLAAKGLQSLFKLLSVTPGQSTDLLSIAESNLIIVATTLAAIGTALAIPTLLFPMPRREE